MKFMCHRSPLFKKADYSIPLSPMSRSMRPGRTLCCNRYTEKPVRLRNAGSRRTGSELGSTFSSAELQLDRGPQNDMLPILGLTCVVDGCSLRCQLLDWCSLTRQNQRHWTEISGDVVWSCRRLHTTTAAN